MSAVLEHAVTIKPLYISKVNSAVQILLIGVSSVQGASGVGVTLLAGVLTWYVAAPTLASGAAYVWIAAHAV